MNAVTPPYIKAAEDLRGNEGQWKAYQSTGNCVILAGPGSGKTKTITVKIARLLAEDVRRPRRIACITYSNACVGELRSRLIKLGIDNSDRLLLSTVHSFCLTELVLPYAAMTGLDVPEPLVVASPAQARKLFGDAYRAQLGGNAPNWFRTACEKLRRTIPDRDGDEWREWSRERRVIEAYEALLLQNGLIDFDGLVLAGLQLIEKHAWVRRTIRAKYPVVVIDEYQDLGLPLHRIVLALLRAGVRIPARWKLQHGAYYYRVPLGLEAMWDDKKFFRLGKRCRKRTKRGRPGWSPMRTHAPSANCWTAMPTK